MLIDIMLLLMCSSGPSSCGVVPVESCTCTLQLISTHAYAHWHIRVRLKIMGSPKCRNVGESESVLIMINSMIFPRTRMMQVAVMIRLTINKLEWLEYLSISCHRL
jgi:hypothetical protein